ncbi:MAG: CBS domain-containing protein [Planctomycetota bacterium]|jgi:CBS domain-containing protein
MDRLDVKRAQVLEALTDRQFPDRNDELTVGQVMTAAPSCIRPETSALELARLLHSNRFRHLIVTEAGGRLLGVVSDRDVIRCFGPEQRPDRATLAKITAADIMSGDLVTAHPSTSLEQAVALMLAEGISCLPVLVDGTLVGILTNTDLHVVLQVLLQTLRQSSSEEPLAAMGARPQI